jgi:chitodextrinase
MKSARLVLLSGMIVCVAAVLTGCLGERTGTPQSLFTASPTEQVIPFTANFDGTLSYDPDGRIATYIWSFGDGGADSGPQASHIYEHNGEYIVQLTVIDDKGISDSSSLKVRALNPPPTGIITYSPKSWCIDKYIVGAMEWITFDASESTDDGEITAYEWDFDDGETASGPVAKHRYLWPRNYEVVLTLIDDDGGQTRVTETLHIMGGPPCNGDICDGDEGYIYDGGCTGYDCSGLSDGLEE